MWACGVKVISSVIAALVGAVGGKAGFLALVVICLMGFESFVLGLTEVDLEVALAGLLAEALAGLVRTTVLARLTLVDVVDLEECDGDNAVVLARLVFSPSIDLFESIIYNYNMKAQKITKKQQAVLNFLEDFTEENGYSPSYREIMTGLGLSSVSAVAEHIDNMVSKGILKKVPGAARSLEVLDFRHTETVELFKNRLGECTEEERGVLVRAAEILGLDLE